MNIDEYYITRCLQIAKNGVGITRPNPSVGAVVVYKDKIIGEGFTSEPGGNHAEVNAINAVKDKSILKEATIYVTLEPCSHYGKTPPCADLIAKHQIKKVVIGCLDINPVVAGRGVKRLKDAGVEVVVGVLKDECKLHHKRFFTFQSRKRPYIILKWAQTLNGFIAPKQQEKQEPFWISNQYSRQITHKLRAKEHAILVGTNTVLKDNPKLNIRSWFGENPVRVILDKDLKLSRDLSVFDDASKTIIITEKTINNQYSEEENLFFEKIDFTKSIPIQVCEVLHKFQIQSLIVEGGLKTLQTFINENLWDETHVFIGNSNLKEGLKAPVFEAELFSEEKIFEDVLIKYIND